MPVPVNVTESELVLVPGDGLAAARQSRGAIISSRSSGWCSLAPEPHLPTRSRSTAGPIRSSVFSVAMSGISLHGRSRSSTDDSVSLLWHALPDGFPVGRKRLVDLERRERGSADGPFAERRR